MQIGTIMSEFLGAGRIWLTAVILAIGLSGCGSTRGGSIAYDVPNFSAPDPIGPAVLAENYQLVPGDKLKITVFRVEELSGDYTVDLAGNISFPLVGTVSATGMSASELGALLEIRLGADYLQSPKVSVAVTESTGRLVTVDGSVREPGTYPVVSRMTLVDAVAMAKGTDDYSNPRRVAIFRQIEGQRMAAAFDLTDIRRGEAEDPRVYPGDVIVVDGSRTRGTLREILTALPVLALFRPY